LQPRLHEVQLFHGAAPVCFQLNESTRVFELPFSREAKIYTLSGTFRAQELVWPSPEPSSAAPANSGSMSNWKCHGVNHAALFANPFPNCVGENCLFAQRRFADVRTIRRLRPGRNLEAVVGEPARSQNGLGVLLDELK
jgi:hypothetical protein